MHKTVLKAGQLQSPTRGRCSLDLRDIGRDAAQLLESARAEAKRIVLNAKHEADAVRQDLMDAARKKGLDEGLKLGREQGMAQALSEAKDEFSRQHAELTAALQSTFTAFQSQRERLYLEAREDVIVLALTIASRVLDMLLSPDAASAASSTAARQACDEALALIAASTDVLIRLHPRDADALQRFGADLAGQLQSGRSVRMAADPDVAPGGVRIESADTFVDATVSEKINRIAAELASGWRERAAKLGIAGYDSNSLESKV